MAKTATAKAPATDGRDDGARASQAQRAYGAIKRQILDNEMPAGFQALEHELAARLGMSRTPVREALIRLEREGLIEIVPRKGMRVVPISTEDMREIYEVITALEARAAERLAERRPSRDDLDRKSVV